MIWTYLDDPLLDLLDHVDTLQTILRFLFLSSDHLDLFWIIKKNNIPDAQWASQQKFLELQKLAGHYCWHTDKAFLTLSVALFENSRWCEDKNWPGWQRILQDSVRSLHWSRRRQSMDTHSPAVDKHIIFFFQIEIFWPKKDILLCSHVWPTIPLFRFPPRSWSSFSSRICMFLFENSLLWLFAKWKV